MNRVCLETQDLCIGYHACSQRKPVASEINLQLYSGRLTCLIGANGIGKSTLLRTLAGLQKPLKGNVIIDDTPMTQFSAQELARKISIVLTDQSHPGNLQVDQVVGLGRLPYTNWLGSLSEHDKLIVIESLGKTNALHLTKRGFGELSDGERQKVMIARALAQEPEVMILDEPTAYLDWPNRVDLLMNLKSIAKDTNKTILISSHDLDLVLQIADQIWLMDFQKPIICGNGPDLIKDGALENVFSSPHGRFDASRGGFRIS